MKDEQFLQGGKDNGLNRSRTSPDELKKENETLQQEVTRLQQVLQEVGVILFLISVYFSFNAFKGHGRE